MDAWLHAIRIMLTSLPCDYVRSVQFFGVIPGGQGFPISQGTFSNVSGVGYGFNCIVPVRAGTTILLVGGDGRSIGTGGWEQIDIQQSGNQSCLDSSSPSSTPGSPAGGYPTSTSSGSAGGGGNGSSSSR